MSCALPLRPSCGSQKICVSAHSASPVAHSRFLDDRPWQIGSTSRESILAAVDVARNIIACGHPIRNKGRVDSCLTEFEEAALLCALSDARSRSRPSLDAVRLQAVRGLCPLSPHTLSTSLLARLQCNARLTLASNNGNQESASQPPLSTHKLLRQVHRTASHSIEADH